VPIISAHTQARLEGYFRLEWKLAAQRTHTMADERTFLLPVVIDATRDTEAKVPAEFKAVQWTWLQGGEASAAFCARVGKLLGGVAPTQSPSGQVAAVAPAAPVSVPRRAPGTPWLLLGTVAVAVVVGIGIYFARRPAPAAAAPRPAALPTASAAPKAALPVATAIPEKSIAVLPFANMSPDAENAFFADGMHDDLITALAKIRDLKVISRTSVLPYKTGERNLRKIAAELGVATILEGSVQRMGNRVRLNIQLIDGRSDAHLWAETYNKELTDVFAIQSALTEEIATALKASLTRDERALIARRPTESQAAYDLYLRARILDQSVGISSSREEIERVLELYERAVVLDPGFALAYAQAANLHGQMFWFDHLDPTPARRALAEASLKAAQRLSPGSPEVLMAQGFVEYAFNNEWAKALEFLQAAEAGLPNDSQLYYRMAVAHRRRGDLQAALARLERAALLNPNDARGVFTLIETTIYLRRYQEVVVLCDRHRVALAADAETQRFRLEAQFQLDEDRAAFRRGLEALPARAVDVHGLERAYLIAYGLGDLERADRILADERLRTVRGVGGVVNEPVALHRAQVAWLQGRAAEARRQAELAAVYYRGRDWGVRQRPVVQFDLARAEALAGNKESALRGVQAALEAQRKLDVLTLVNLQAIAGQVMIICGEPESALALLREQMKNYDRVTPAWYRLDPFWSRLKSDPRFEEILRSARQL
jgi:TolB-like protein